MSYSKNPILAAEDEKNAIKDLIEDVKTVNKIANRKEQLTNSLKINGDYKGMVKIYDKRNSLVESVYFECARGIKVFPDR